MTSPQNTTRPPRSRLLDPASPIVILVRETTQNVYRPSREWFEDNGLPYDADALNAMSPDEIAQVVTTYASIAEQPITVRTEVAVINENTLPTREVHPAVLAIEGQTHAFARAVSTGGDHSALQIWPSRDAAEKGQYPYLLVTDSTGLCVPGVPGHSDEEMTILLITDENAQQHPMMVADAVEYDVATLLSVVNYHLCRSTDSQSED